MRHLIFEQSDTYPVVVLIKTSYLRQYELEQNYLLPLVPEVPIKDVVAIDLAYDQNGKAPAKLIKEYLEELLPAIDSIGGKFIYCADAAYFKALTKQTKGKAESHIGYVVPCRIPGYEHLQVILGVNYGQLVYNPDQYHRLDLTLKTLKTAYSGNYQELGLNIIHGAEYPKSPTAIADALRGLMIHETLSCDIEGFSLHPMDAGIGTIAFAWDHHHGLAFPVDYLALPEPQDGHHGVQRENRTVRKLLRSFFEQYQGRLRFHNAAYDVGSLIYALWMEHAEDWEGLLKGLHLMCRSFDDTKVIAYLALNSTAEVKLSLKDLAHEFAGNYAQDEITDIRRIPQDQLLEYNLVDCLATNYVYDKHYPTMVADQQEELYRTLMLPSLKTIIQMVLVGMPMDPDKIQYAKEELQREEASYLKVFQNNPIIQQLEKTLTDRAWEKDYQDRKAKAKNPDKIMPKLRAGFPTVEFNPNSGPQLQVLLYEQLGLPVLDRTKTKQPAVGGDTLEKLTHHTGDPAVVELIEALIGHTGVTKILTAFIPKFEEAKSKESAHVTWLHGNFNLGGTVSGRLSSSKPNLQNLPSNSKYGKLIKDAFVAQHGWIMVGADFNSLEDYISALTTKDPNKLKVYTDGYDGHCLRAFAYFPDRLPGIIDTVDSINSIKKKFPDIRQLSKTPTFALTYQGTYITLMKNLGFDEKTAKQIEANYHELYRVSDEWVQAKLDEAAQRGYVEVAFGLRVRTPLLAQVIRGHRTTPYQAEAEARTAGNALGQSYGLLNNRAANAFMERVWASKHRTSILPIAQIHDSQYFLIRDDLEVVDWVNRNLIAEMQWQELPEIQHDTVKLGAALDLFWPSWAHPLTLPNEAPAETILTLSRDHRASLEDEFREVA